MSKTFGKSTRITLPKFITGFSGYSPEADQQPCITAAIGAVSMIQDTNFAHLAPIVQSASTPIGGPFVCVGSTCRAS